MLCKDIARETLAVANLTTMAIDFIRGSGAQESNMAFGGSPPARVQNRRHPAGDRRQSVTASGCPYADAGARPIGRTTGSSLPARPPADHAMNSPWRHPVRADALSAGRRRPDQQRTDMMRTADVGRKGQPPMTGPPANLALTKFSMLPKTASRRIALAPAPDEPSLYRAMNHRHRGQ